LSLSSHRFIIVRRAKHRGLRTFRWGKAIGEEKAKKKKKKKKKIKKKNKKKKKKKKKKEKQTTKEERELGKTISIVSERRRDSGSTGNTEEGNQDCWDMGEMK
jgi:seryl-tRNA synthetase